MNKTKLCTYALLASVVSLSAYARPVSYPGGWTVMQMHDADRTSLHVHYSPTFKKSIGVRYENQQDDNSHLGGLQVNHLLGRINKKGSQANFYLKTFAGISSKEADIDPAGSLAFATDWETRRHFVSYEAHVEAVATKGSSFHQTGRVGIAPYIGDYGDLHTWLMLQVDHRPDDIDETFTATPLVRFFKGRDMLEAGVQLDTGKAMLNYIHRF